jgi:hypothetical protein
MNTEIKDIREAQEFLKKLGAPPRLIRHVCLVGEAADLLIEKLSKMGISFDASFVRLSVLFHDAGKIVHPKELVGKGNQHELDGEILLIRNGIDPRLARCCKSHGQWKMMECSLEELLVAASDKLWKGKREADLEKEIIERLSKLVNQDYWELFIEMDSYFEMIAANGEERLSRSI